MSSKRFDICQGNERGGKTYWNKIGTLWQNDDGRMSIDFSALPIASLNTRSGACETRAVVFEAKARGEGGGAPSGGGQTQGGGFSSQDYGAGKDDDSIPF